MAAKYSVWIVEVADKAGKVLHLAVFESEVEARRWARGLPVPVGGKGDIWEM